MTYYFSTQINIINIFSIYPHSLYSNLNVCKHTYLTKIGILQPVLFVTTFFSLNSL